MPEPKLPSPERLEEIARSIERVGKEFKLVTAEELVRLKAMNKILLGGEKGREYYGGEGSLLAKVRDYLRPMGAKAPGRALERAEMEGLERLAGAEGLNPAERLNAVLDRLRFQFAEQEMGRLWEMIEEISPSVIMSGVKTPFRAAIGRLWEKLKEQRSLRGRFSREEYKVLTDALDSYAARNPTSNIARLGEEHQKARLEQRELWAEMQALPPGPEKDHKQLSWLTREITEMQPRWDREMVALGHLRDPLSREEVLSVDLARQWNRFERREVRPVPAPPAAPPPAPAVPKFRFTPSVPKAPVKTALPQGKEFYIRQMRENWGELTEAEKLAISRLTAGEALTKGEMKAVSLSAVNFVVKYMKDHGLTYAEVSGIETLAPRRVRDVALEY